MGSPNPSLPYVPAYPEEALANLTQVLVHRIGGLVSGIEGYTGLLLDTLGTREQRDLTLRIFESVSRIEHVLTGLKQFSHPVAPVLRRRAVRQVIEDTLGTLEDTELDRIRLDLRLKGDVQVNVDQVLIRQALLVLLQNALEASRQNIDLGVCEEQGQVRFLIRNEGTIDMERADVRVFMPFVTTKAQNLGIGLYLARRIVEAHGGSLHLMGNSPEEGTRFALALPQG
jgi:C4-dicarboxylate-specific signal transduction histidine kinase